MVAQKLKFFHGILSVSCKFVCNSSSAETTETEFLPHMLELNKTQHKLLTLCIKVASKKSGSEFHKM